jgi:hypothetical protein
MDGVMMERKELTGLPIIRCHKDFLQYKREYYRLHKNQWKEWEKKHPDYHREKHQKLKLKAMQKISGQDKPICSGCGCSVLETLEINHKIILTQEAKGKRGAWFYRQIIRGERSVQDLDIRCRVCNSAHYLLERFGMKFKIEFLGA